MYEIPNYYWEVFKMKKFLVVTGILLFLLIPSTSMAKTDVFFNLGIGLPLPVFVAPAPVIFAPPPPVVVYPAPIYAPPPVFYQSAPVFYGPPGWYKGNHYGQRGWYRGNNGGWYQNYRYSGYYR
jgi:hypothetical protein